MNKKRDFKPRKGEEAKAFKLFSLPIGAIESPQQNVIEKEIRLKVGILVKKDKAKELELLILQTWF